MITATIYKESLAAEWDAFVQQRSRNGGIFHERRFLGYHDPGKFQDASLVFYDGSELIGVFPAAYIEQEGVKKVISHPGSSNGGLVYERSATLDVVLAMLEALILQYQGEHVSAIEMKIGEPVFNPLPDGELMYLLWHRGFNILTQEISSCVKLSDYKSWEALSRKRNLSYIRKLEREGVTVTEVDDVNTVYPVIEENLKERYNKKPTHSRDELAKLKELFPERTHFWIAGKDDEVLGTIVLFDVNETGVHDFYIAKNEKKGDTKVMPLLFHKVFEHYHAKGFSWFNFGISSRGQEIKWGILEFKESAGGRATLRQVWELRDVSNYKKYEGE